MAEKNEAASTTPYDDVFRTMITDSSLLAVSLINGMFGEHLPKDAKVESFHNEMYLRSGAKRITDSHMKPEGVGVFHAECELRDGDKQILIRLFEYDSLIAVNDARVDGNTLYARYPRTGLLYLQASDDTPDALKMVVRSPDSTETLHLDVAVMKVRDYSLEDIFEKELWFLLPYFIFNFKSRLGSSIEEKREAAENDVLEALAEIKTQLDLLNERGDIDSYSVRTLEDMICKIYTSVAEKSERIVKGVIDIMGGQVLEHRAKTIYNQGVSVGVNQGIDNLSDAIQQLNDGKTESDLKKAGVDEEIIQRALECWKDERKSLIEQLLRDGKTPQMINDFIGYPISEITAVQKKMTEKQ